MIIFIANAIIIDIIIVNTIIKVNAIIIVIVIINTNINFNAIVIFIVIVIAIVSLYLSFNLRIPLA